MTNSAVSVMLMLAALGQVRGFQRPNTPPPGARAGGAIQPQELTQQLENYKKLWDKELERKLSELPTEGTVPEFRVPYSGHDYPDYNGGTVGAMAKYDSALHSGRSLAADYERSDVSAHRAVKEGGRGLLGRLRGGRVPGWYGHCNGWTAASIRHAEPQTSVTRNGVVLSPADIKGLLAELYMYSETAFLGGIDNAVNPGSLHLALTNWIGRGAHPIGMETALGEVVINFPLYGYKSTVTRLSDRQYDVRTTIDYTLHVSREVDKGPKNPRQMYFHYILDLDANGLITGGRYLGDSAMVDMLWVPLNPVQGGQKGNERGNPHLDVKEVLAIWRESVPEEIRKKWFTVDAPEEDRRLFATNSSASETPTETAKPAEQEKANNAAAGAGDGANTSAEAPSSRNR